MKKQRHILRRIFKYGVFGAVSAGLEFVTFLILNTFYDLYISSVGSFFIGLVASFFFNKFIVFQKKGFAHKEVAYFLLLGIFNSQFSSLFTIMLAGLTNGVIAKILSIGLIAGWNYIVMNYFIFQKKQ